MTSGTQDESFQADALKAEVLQASIAKAHHLDLDVVVHEEIDSTNDWSLQQCKNGRALPFACFAENQTAGKGRRGKHWLMSARSNIAMSLSWPYDLSRQSLRQTQHQGLHLLPLSIALAVAKTLQQLKLQQVQIKWPNDVYVQGKKIAGILIETQALKNNKPINKKPINKLINNKPIDKKPINNKLTAVVIGIGLNYDMSMSQQLQARDRNRDMALIAASITDIKAEMKAQEINEGLDEGVDVIVERDVVASLLLKNVVDVCQNFQQKCEQYLSEFRERYDYCKNKTVEVSLENNTLLSGVALGVNNNAELIVVVDGVEQTFNSAEVSVKAERP